MYFTPDLVPKFSARDKTYSATKFITKIEDNGEKYGWTQRERLLVARLSLTGTALLWLRSEETFRTWDELKKALEEEFPDDVASSSLWKVETIDSCSSTEERLETFLTSTQDGATVVMTYENVESIIDSGDELTQVTQVSKQNECQETDFITNSNDPESNKTVKVEEVTQLGGSCETYDVEEAIIGRKDVRPIGKTSLQKHFRKQKDVKHIKKQADVGTMRESISTQRRNITVNVRDRASEISKEARRIKIEDDNGDVHKVDVDVKQFWKNVYDGEMFMLDNNRKRKKRRNERWLLGRRVKIK